jgi:thioredoxin 1
MKRLPVLAESSAKTFAEDVLLSELPVLVDFWAEWCGPCKMVAPVLEELSTELDSSLKIVKVNADDNTSLVAEFSIRSIPTMIIFVKGKEVKRITGAKPKPALLVELKEVLG